MGEQRRGRRDGERVRTRKEGERGRERGGKDGYTHAGDHGLCLFSVQNKSERWGISHCQDNLQNLEAK